MQARFHLFRQRLRSLWNNLIEPHNTIIDPNQRRQARLLNYLLLPIFASMIFQSQWNGPTSVYLIYVAGSLLIVLAAYWFNRAGRYAPAARLASILMSAAAFINFFMREIYHVPAPDFALLRIVVAIMIAYLLLTLPELLMISVVDLVGIGLIAVSAPSDYPFIASTIYFSLITMSLMLIAANSRRNQLRQIEQQASSLKDTEARYRNLLEASFELIIVHREGTILDTNPAIETFLGYQPDEILGTQIIDLVEPSYREEATRRYRLGDNQPYELMVLHKNGTELHAELRAKSAWFHGQLLRFVAIRDITERKHQEEFALEREKVRVLQTVISNLSHDLRTPLSVINTSIYLIERLAQSPERQRHQIEVLQNQAELMQRLLEDLIQMSRLDKADTHDFKFRWMNINDPVTQAIRDHQGLALRRQQRLDYELTPNLPEVLIDEEQFRLAIKHLILNGLSYTAAGGVIRVCTLANEQHVIVEVHDNGVGIHANDLPHIFEHFYRADKARTIGGTGVGLTIVKRIVEVHGGQVSAESRPGEGSTFSILLPIHQD